MLLAEKKNYSICSEVRLEKKIKVKIKQDLLKYSQVIIVVLICFSFGLFYTYKHIQVINLGYKIDELKQNIAIIQRDNKRLELKIAELQAPDRIETIAKNKLGMRNPDKLLLAALPQDASSSRKIDKSIERKNYNWKKYMFLASKKLINRAEASPR